MRSPRALLPLRTPPPFAAPRAGCQTPARRARTHIGRALCLLTFIALLGFAPLRAHEAPRHQIAELTARLKAAPRDEAELYLRRADLYRQVREWPSALADLAQAAQLDPRDPVVDLERARTLFDAGRPGEALVAVDAYRRRAPEEAEGALLRARILVRLDRQAEGAAEFTQALALLDPESVPSPDLFLERARALLTLGRREEALAGLREGVARLGVVPALEQLATELAGTLSRAMVADPRGRLSREEGGFGRSEPPGGRTAFPEPAAGGHGGPPLPMLRALAAGEELRPPAVPSAAARPLPLPAGTPVLTRGPYLQLGTPTSVVVRWRTSVASDSRIRFGPSPLALGQTMDLPGARTEHAVTLAGLNPGTRYFYTVGTGSDTLGCLDGSCTFVTAPPAGTAKPTRVWVIGDSGTKDAGAAAVRDTYAAFTGSRSTDLWLMLGDNAYDTGTDAEYQAAVFEMYPTLLRTSVLWPTLGNHDAFHPEVYFQLFTLPTAGEAGGVPSGTESYYSFDFGTLHFICLDSQDSDRSPNGAMLTWLRADLGANRQPWVIAFWHHPPYTKGSHDSDAELNLIEMRQAANPILEAAGVDLVLSGHSHSYERSFLLDRHYGPSSTLTPGMILDDGDGSPAGDGAYEKGSGPHQGAIYAVAGSSGQLQGLRHHPAMAVGLAIRGSLVLDVDGDRLNATFLQSDGRLGDTFTLHKSLPPSPPPPPAETTVTFASIGAQDGYLVEASEESEVGGGADAALSAGGALRLGDTTRDRQLRALVSFDTSALPDGATIVGAKLRLTRGGVTGSDPFATHGRCRVEARRGVFGGSRALSPADFQAPATSADAGTLAPPAPGSNVAEAVLDADGLAALNRTGTTQLRLSFVLGDDDDGAPDFAGFYSGESATPERRPLLVITYR